MFANSERKHSREKNLALDILWQREASDASLDYQRVNLTLWNSQCHNWLYMNWSVYLVWVVSSLFFSPSLFPPSLCQVWQALYFFILSSLHFFILASRSVTPPWSRLPFFSPAARSGDRLACSWFNNCFVTLCVFVLQRSRLSDQVS